MEEFNIFSWPDFNQDVVGRDALEERRNRDQTHAVVIRATTADSATNLVAVHWNDFEQVRRVAWRLMEWPPCNACGLMQCATAGSAATVVALHWNDFAHVCGRWQSA